MSSKAETKSARNGSKRALTPKRRFPEFGGQRLRETRLKNVTAESTTRNGEALPSTAVMGVSKVDGIIPMEQRIIASDIARYKLVQKDWFAYNPMRLNIGSIARWQGESDILVSPDYVVFRCLNETDTGLDPTYLDQFRRSLAWDNFVKQGGDGGVRVRIYYDAIGDLELALPALAEQQKIADCLSSVDDLIAAQVRKVDALKAHKTGLMRQLFPRKGETNPRLRFPEFQDAGDWETKSIGQLGDVVTGSTPSTARSEYFGGGRLFVSPGDISDNRFIETTKTTLTDIGFEEARPIRANSTLFVCIGSTIGKVAQNQHECATNQQINAVVPYERYDDGFVYYALSSIADEIAGLAGIQAVPIVNKSLFSSIELAVPRHPEQTRIAVCLSSLDEAILAAAQKLSALKGHKRGVMHQLFPSMEEAP